MGDLSNNQGKSLNEIYFDVSHPASFSSIESLYKAVKDKGISRKNVREFLETSEAYTLHKTPLKKFPRRKIPVFNIGDRFELDLVDMKTYSQYNDNFNYLLMGIDCFSRKGFIVPLKRKTADEVLKGLKIMFSPDKSNSPRKIYFDSGKEFVNFKVRKFLKERNIKFDTMTSEPHHAPFVERFNRTIKTRMHKYFTHYNTYRYIDQIDNFLNAYNSAYHSSIKMAPNNVNPTNILRVYKNIYKKDQKTKKIIVKTPKFQLGDYVRVSKLKSAFAKGYEGNFSIEVFKIVGILKSRVPHLYKLQDLEGSDIKGYFYSQQLIKCSKPRSFKIESILKKRKRKGKLEYFVKFLGLPKSQNSWVLAENVEQIGILPDATE